MSKEKYQLTFKGVLHAELDENLGERALRAIEIYMRRIKRNGIVLTKHGFDFVKLEKVD
jgi:hypothetical protein